jgi:hypothetical protein
VDDSSDCIIKSAFLPHHDSVDFDSRIAGLASAVSDNTRFWGSHRPTVLPSSRTKLPSLSTVDQLGVSDSLPSICEEPVGPSLSIPSPEPIETSVTFPITFDAPPESTSQSSLLSPKQVQEVLQLLTMTLEKDGRITPELLHYVKVPSSSTKTSSSTPPGHPILLSCGKMSNTAPNHMRYMVQQLSQYFGFKSFKNWDVLYDVCQPIFSFNQSSDLPLELGQVANIKKARCNKLLWNVHLIFWKLSIVILVLLIVSLLVMGLCIVLF